MKEMVLCLVLVRHIWGSVFTVNQHCSLEHFQRKERAQGKQEKPTPTFKQLKGYQVKDQ